MALEKKDLFKMYFHNFFYYLPLEKDMALHLNKFEFLHPRCFVQSLVEIGTVVPEKILKFCQYNFTLLLSPLGNGCGPLFEQT